MATVVEAAKLHASEVWALYGGELEYCLGSEGADQEAEVLERQSSECNNGRVSVCESPRYSSQLEALKRMHLQNVAELEVKYLKEIISDKSKPHLQAPWKVMEQTKNIPQDAESLPVKQESNALPSPEVEDHLNSVSKIKDDTSEDKRVERGQTEKRQELAEVQVTPTASGSSSKSSSSSSSDHSRDSSRRSSGAEPSGVCSHEVGGCSVAGNRGANVTVPKPFKMMLREEDKKRRNVKTRSEMELENTLLRKELEELRQSRRNFRATPAPPGTHLALGEVLGQRGGRTASLDRAARRDRDRDGGQRRTRSRNTSPQPFSFMERERKKREQRLEAALAALASREDPWVFRARPLPRIYRQSSEDYPLFSGKSEPPSRGREQHREMRKEQHNHRLEKEQKSRKQQEQQQEQHQEMVESQKEVHFCKADKMDAAGRSLERPVLEDSNWRLRRKPSVAAKALLLEGEMNPATSTATTAAGTLRRSRGTDWSYIHPIHRTGISLNLAASLSGSQERIAACKSDYISV